MRGVWLLRRRGRSCRRATSSASPFVRRPADRQHSSSCLSSAPKAPAGLVLVQRYRLEDKVGIYLWRLKVWRRRLGVLCVEDYLLRLRGPERWLISPSLALQVAYMRRGVDSGKDGTPSGSRAVRLLFSLRLMCSLPRLTRRLLCCAFTERDRWPRTGTARGHSSESSSLRECLSVSPVCNLQAHSVLWAVGSLKAEVDRLNGKVQMKRAQKARRLPRTTRKTRRYLDL